jgi:hypothetical protein
MGRNMRTGYMVRLVFRLKPMRLLSVGLHEVESVLHGKPEARHQLVKAIDEATVFVGNVLGHTQCHNW